MPAQFDRSLPSNPDLDQQKKLAKELLRAFREGDAEAQARVRAKLPDKQSIVLADAQFVLAREYGFANWAALKERLAQPGADAAVTAEWLMAAFRKLVENRNHKALRELLEAEPDVRSMINEPVFAFDSPALVHVANNLGGFADGLAAEMVNVLLEFGADPNRSSAWWAGGFHPLYNATGAAAERLLAAGAIPDACAAAHLDMRDLLARMIAENPARVHERGGDGQTPLHFAVSREVIDLLLAAGADPDARDVDHRSTPAQWMLRGRRGAGRYHLAEYLVSRGASADIFLAAALGLTERTRALLAANPSLLELHTTQGDYGEQPPSSFHIYMWTIGGNLSPLQVAIRFDQVETLAVMREFATPRQQLLTALASGDSVEAHAMIREHAGLLDTLTREDRQVLPEAGSNANATAVQLMLDLGFDPATPNAGGATVLHCAAWEGSAECVAAILRHPAASSLVEHQEPAYHGTPLGWCFHGSCHAGPGKNHVAVARMLLDAGAQPGAELGDVSDEVRAVIETWVREH
jgi:ankyrin repeat protein